MATRFVPVTGTVFLAVLLVLALPSGLRAHTAFDRSVPADGDVVDVAPPMVVVVFSKPVTLVGPGFEALLPDGSIIVPVAESEDGSSWTLVLPEEMEAGELAVRYDVLAADDGHPISGGFSFVATQGTRTAATSTPTTSQTEGTADPAPSSTAPSQEPAVTAEDGAEAVPLEDRLTPAEFLETTGSGSPIIGWFGRVLGLLAVLTAIGLLAMVVRVVQDDELAVVSMLELAALAGMLLVVAAGLESYALATEGGIEISSLLSSRLGVSPMLRAVSGSLLAALALAAEHRLARWALALAVVIGVSSYTFDGHTVSTGPRWLHAAVDFVHVMAAGTWAGGLALLFLQLRSNTLTRHRRTELLLRFSTIAGLALAPVFVAGLAMAWFVADSPGDLVSTTWGRVLVAKTSLVAVAVLIGGLNRYRLLPRLTSATADGPPSGEERVLSTITSTIRLEIIALLLATLLTAGLVVASTS